MAGETVSIKVSTAWLGAAAIVVAALVGIGGWVWSLSAASTVQAATVKKGEEHDSKFAEHEKRITSIEVNVAKGFGEINGKLDAVMTAVGAEKKKQP